MSQPLVAIDLNKVKANYEFMAKNNIKLRQKCGRALTFAEKVLFNHLTDDSGVATLERGKSFLMLNPDRITMQDATAQMAILQFIQSRKTHVAVPTTVHCDHLIRAYIGVREDMKAANQDNSEVYNFLKSASNKYGIGFWGPGSGIIHQVVLENYAYPGSLLIGTDSHTPNGGGLGTVAIGVGGADAVDVMAGKPWELLNPKLLGVHLKGKLQPWSSPKDVILKVLEILTVKGGTNKIIEYFGEGANSISCTGKGTITNMGAELGATTSLFPFDKKMADFLEETSRKELAKLATQYSEDLRSDPEVEASPEDFYDEVIEVDLSALEPYIVGPHSPDKARPVSEFKQEIKAEDYPSKISACLVGSCTNSSYEDLYKASEVAKYAMSQGLKAQTQLMITPGSMQIYSTIKRDGILDTLERFGGKVLANACGPCIGQWKRDEIKLGDRNSIVTSFNRNFRGRNDANPETLSFITSPEMVIAYAISGDLRFNPLSDKICGTSLPAPQAPELPTEGFVKDSTGYIEPAVDGSKLEIIVKEDSQRLQILDPFPMWNGKDFEGHLLLLKAKGKCTTDHISPAGKWLKYRGHLDNISDNMFSGANNAFRDNKEKSLNQITNETGQSFAEIARDYKKNGRPWVVVGDENYGEGSSREHAAMSPRLLGVSTVIVKSFARIHETNLKKQGVLALTFANQKDYDKIDETDTFAISALKNFSPNKNLEVTITKLDGSRYAFLTRHSYNKEQIEWFKSGSALNLIS